MSAMDWAVLAACATAALSTFVALWIGERLPRHGSTMWVITCPEGKTSVIVEIAARNSGSGPAPDHTPCEVRDCSLWSLSRSCRRTCLQRLKLQPGGSLVLTDRADQSTGPRC
jgi:hypothetical protein